MQRVHVPLLIAGIVVLVIFAALFGYVWRGESQMRARAGAPADADFGFVPIDLLRGRTHFEKRQNGNVVFSLDSGPMGQSRVAIARAACGLGLLGAALLSLGLFMKGSRKGP